MKNKTLKSLLMITFLAGTVTLVGCNNDNQTRHSTIDRPKAQTLLLLETNRLKYPN